MARFGRVRPYGLLLGLALTLLVADQASKYWVHELSGLTVGHYPPRGGIVLIPGFLALVHVHNTGAAWGMLEGFTTPLALLAGGALVTIYLFRRSLELQLRVPQICFGLVCGGIAGNLIDRLHYGYVVDFIDADLGFYRWPTFNLADSGMVVGAIVYAGWSLLRENRSTSAENA